MTPPIRVPLVAPGTRPELSAIERSIAEQRGSISVLYQVLLNSAPLASGWEKLLTAVRNQTSVPADLRELIILRVAVLNRATFEFDAHVPNARQAGIADAKMDAVRHWRAKSPDAGPTGATPGVIFSDDEQLVLELADAMTRDIEVPDATDGTAARALRRSGSRRGRRHRRRLQHGFALPGGVRIEHWARGAGMTASTWRARGVRATRASRHRNPERVPGIMPAMTSPPISPRQKARILAEALPFIRAFHASTLIIRFGGGAMADPGLKEGFARDVALLRLVGMNPIIVHGGGWRIDDLLRTMGIEIRQHDGVRVTDEATLNVVEMVLGEINQELVGLINRFGAKAVGLSGQDGRFIHARRMTLPPDETGGAARDVGLVGEVESIDPDVIHLLMSRGFIPVIMPIGVGADGTAYHINSDAFAGALARTLHAEKLILMTNVPGIHDRDGKLAFVLSAGEAEGAAARRRRACRAAAARRRRAVGRARRRALGPHHRRRRGERACCSRC